MRAMPCIDSQPLAALVAAFETARNFDVQGGYTGVIPRGRPWNRVVFPAEFVLADPVFGRTGDGSVILLECMCGVEGCWPLLGRVRLSDATVIWDDFCQPHRPARDYTGFGPFTFDIQPVQTLQSVVSTASGYKWKPS